MFKMVDPQNSNDRVFNTLNAPFYEDKKDVKPEVGGEYMLSVWGSPITPVIVDQITNDQITLSVCEPLTSDNLNFKKQTPEKTRIINKSEYSDSFKFYPFGTSIKKYAGGSFGGKRKRTGRRKTRRNKRTSRRYRRKSNRRN